MRVWFLVLTATLFSGFSIAKDITLSSPFVIPRSIQTGFGLGPQERTRPVVVGDILYFATRAGVVHAVHRTEGYTLWKMHLPGSGGVDGAFAYGRSLLYVGDTAGNLFAIRARDGSIAWKISVGSPWLSPPLVFRDRVIATTSSEEVYALSEKDGSEKWHYSRRGDEKMTIRGSPVPTMFGNDVYVGFADGYLVALNGTDGRTLWAKRLRSRERFYDVDMAPSADQDGVIAATFDGNLYRLDRTTGEIAWVFRVGSYGGFLVEENRIYFAGLNGSLYAIDKGTGTPVWRTEYSGGVGATPVRVGEYLVVTTSSDPVYVVSPEDGKVKATTRLGTGSLAAAASHVEGWFYCLSNFGNLFSYRILDFRESDSGPIKLQGLSALKRFE